MQEQGCVSSASHAHPVTQPLYKPRASQPIRGTCPQRARSGCCLSAAEKPIHPPTFVTSSHDACGSTCSICRASCSLMAFEAFAVAFTASCATPVLCASARWQQQQQRREQQQLGTGARARCAVCDCCCRRSIAWHVPCWSLHPCVLASGLASSAATGRGTALSCTHSAAPGGTPVWLP
jgi:hypothetical protein